MANHSSIVLIRLVASASKAFSSSSVLARIIAPSRLARMLAACAFAASAPISCDSERAAGHVFDLLQDIGHLGNKAVCLRRAETEFPRLRPQPSPHRHCRRERATDCRCARGSAHPSRRSPFRSGHRRGPRPSETTPTLRTHKRKRGARSQRARSCNRGGTQTSR
jgi:hypothetical protein